MIILEVTVMLIRRPDYFSRFRCLAGDCPDTCCAGWDIVIDDESLECYQQLPGEFGERVRAAITVDEDGDHCFSVSGGHCPLLTKERLCAVQLELGEERVCAVCRAHPRFIEEYGPLREESLAASCPGAAELLLGSPEPAGFVTEESAEADTVCDDVDLPLLGVLLDCREKAFALVQDRERPLGERLAGLLDRAALWQDALDEGGLADALGCKDAYTLPEARGPEVRREVMSHLLERLGTLEVLDPAWGALLERTRAALGRLEPEEYAGLCRAQPVRAWEYEHVAVYFLYRWFLRADFDGDLYAKAALAVVSCLTVRELALGRWLEERPEQNGCGELLRRWCKEQEHCAENLAALAEWCWNDPLLSPEALAGAAMG